MAQIIQFPAEASKFGYKRVRKCSRRAEHPDQLQLFPQTSARILNLAAPAANGFERALLLDDLGDSSAAGLYHEVIEQGECVADAYCNLGIIESKKGNTAKAFDCFTNALKHEPRHAEAQFNLGNLYFDVNDLRLAQVHYEIATEIAPAFANAHFNLALIQAINHDIPAAIKTLTTYQQLVPAEESRKADELLTSLRCSLRGSGAGSAPAQPHDV